MNPIISLQDIDPIIVEKVLQHAEKFIEVDARINTIVQWGIGELENKEREILEKGEDVEMFVIAAQDIERVVKVRLAELTQEMSSMYET